MYLEILFIGDPHLSKLSKYWEEKQALGYQLRALEDAFRYALDNSIEHVVILGDIFEDPEPTQRYISALLELLHKYRKSLIFHIIRGNHDMDDIERNSLEVLNGVLKLEALRNVRLYLSPELVEINKVPILFMSYPYHDISRWLKPEDFALVIPHLEFKGAVRDNGHVASEGLTIPKGKQHWISGHLHTRQELGNRLVYPGTMLQLNIVEKLPKFFLHTTVQNKRVSHKFIEYKPPCKLFNLAISSNNELEAIKNKPNYYYRLVLKDGVELPPDFLARHPNVTLAGRYVDKKGMKAALEEKMALEDNIQSDFDPVYGLSSYLQLKGYEEQAVKRLCSLADKARSGLGI